MDKIKASQLQSFLKINNTNTSSAEEIKKSSTLSIPEPPTMPKPPVIEYSSWEKAGKSARNIQNGFGIEGVLSQVGTSIKVEDLEEVNTGSQTSEEKRQDIMAQIQNNPEALKNYQNMQPEEKEKFMTLGEQMYTSKGPGLFSKSPIKGTNINLIKLLEEGKLSDKDSEGKSLLDNLILFSTQKFAEGIDGKFALENVISKLTGPELKGMGMGMEMVGFSDPATKLEEDNIKNNPSEYIRIVAGLCSEKGEVKLPSGDILKRNEDILKNRKVTGGIIGGMGGMIGNVSVSEIYQSSIREYTKNKSLTSEEKQKDIRKIIDGNQKAKENFDKMTREEQDKFFALAEKTGIIPGLSIMNSSMPPQMNQNLITLLEEGKLSDKDSEGKTLLDNLTSLQNQTFAEGINDKFIVYEVIWKIASAGKTMGIGMVDSGGVYPFNNLEQDNIKNNPSEYIRIISGLSGEKGEVKLPNGEILKRSEGVLTEKPPGSKFGGLPGGMGGVPGGVSASEIYQSSIKEHMEHREVSSTEKRDFIMKEIEKNPKALDNFNKMPEGDQKKFLSLIEKIYIPGITIMASTIPPKINMNLITLLEQGKLSDKDSEVKTLLDNLITLQSQKFPEELNGQFIFFDVIRKIIKPESEGHNGVASLEVDNIKNNPSEYVRIIAGLSGEKGEVKLPSGETLKRRDELLKKEKLSASGLYQSSIKDYTENSNISSEDKRNYIMTHIEKDSKAKEIFMDMPPEEKEEFLSLAEKTYHEGITIMDSNMSQYIDENLIILLKEGKLKDKDKDGKSLLHILTDMEKQEFSEGLDGKKILEETLRNLARPDSICQKSKGTCTVTTLEYIHAKNHPAEYARIMAGLTSKSGEVTLLNGDKLVRDEGLIEDDFSGRSAVDRIYQASMMEYGNGERDYINKEDASFRVEIKPDGTRSIVETDKHGGLPSSGLNKTMNAVLPYISEVQYFTTDTPENRKVFEEKVNQALSEGKPVPVTLSWGKNNYSFSFGSHELAVEKIDDTYVYLRNPWGDDDDMDSPGNAIANDPARDIVPPGGSGPSGGHIRMSKDEFYRRLIDYTVPVQVLPDIGKIIGGTLPGFFF
ncbi:MAG TPA: hypothetical protein PL110_13685 [Candidatus Eremiobacteraeota bacterium]|nr:hypothetical protein [Candidatus Eremiobacteraeota bacterium]